MLYLFGIITALQIVAAQTLWKVGLEKINFLFSREFIFSGQVVKVLSSPYIIAGVLLYASATIIFFGMLTRFTYANTQTVVVTTSLIFTFLSAVIIFGEQLKPVNLAGVGFLLLGVLLITKL
jgi:drug/metabolite transporter (DMT)-like permease